MLDLGVVKPGSTIYVPVNTFDSNDPSGSVTATDWANTDCHVHRNGGTTQRASSAGETLTLNFDSVNGNHLLAIDLSDNTTAGFYTAGATYHVRIEGVTVDGGTINAWIAQWRIGYPGAWLDTTIATLASQTSFTLTAGAADDDAYNGWLVVVHDIASAVQVAIGYVLDYTGSSKTITLAADPGIFTMAAGDNISLFPPGSLAQHMLSSIATNNAVGHVTIDTGEASAVSGSAAALTAAQAASDVLDEALSGHTTAGSLGKAVADIEDDTSELQADWANGGRLDLLIDGIKAVTDLLNAAQAEPTGVPAANETPLDKIGYLFMGFRNRVDVTASKKTFYGDDDAAEFEKDLSDNGTTYSESEANAI